MRGMICMIKAAAVVRVRVEDTLVFGWDWIWDVVCTCLVVFGSRCAASDTLMFRYLYKGSAWVPAFAGTYASGRAGQHFELFDSILGRVKKVTTHSHGLHVQYVR